MISSEVQRTLVKSPPELWAELSDPTALSRHLGELGEIRITRAEPEKRIDWETDRISGTVQIKPSGWGTKVTLSVNRELDPPAPTEPVSEIAPIEGEKLEPAAEQSDPRATTAPEANGDTIAEPTPVADSEPSGAVTLVTPPRRGFFARLFGRGKPSTGHDEHPLPAAPLALDQSSSGDEVIVPDAPPAAERKSSAIESLQARFQASETPEQPFATVEMPAAAVVDEPPKPADIAAELEAAEAVAAQEVTAVLTAALDRLGAAHHRPFSRS